MNKVLLFIFTTTLLTSLACSKIDQLTQFDLEYSYDTTIESVIGINLPFNLVTPPITSNISEAVEINNTRKDLIEEATVQSLKVLITNPDGDTFDFLKEIEIFIDAENLDETMVASAYDISNDIGNELVLDVVSDLNLKDYIQQDEFDLNIKIVTDKLLLHDIDIRADALFNVDAKILGI